MHVIFSVKLAATYAVYLLYFLKITFALYLVLRPKTPTDWMTLEEHRAGLGAYDIIHTTSCHMRKTLWFI